ncbi:MAG: TIR domain-containing protein [Anaerolineae bacterium]
MADRRAYTYDVFISHSPADREWVDNWLLPRLEQAGLRVAVDYRDFIVGMPRIENVERTLANSRRTIVVLTPEWLTSEWNAFEALLLRTMDPAARQRKLLPVLLRPCELPDLLASLDKVDLTAERYWDRQVNRLKKSLVDEIPVPLPSIPDLPGWWKWLYHYRRQVRSGVPVALLVWLVASLVTQLPPFQPRLGWQVVGQVEAQPAWRLARAGNVLFIGSNSTPNDCNARDTGLWRSNDEGSTWQPAAGEPLLIERTTGQCLRANVSDLAVASRDGQTTIYAATTASKFRNTVGLLRSTDLGTTWTRLAANALDNDNLVRVIALDNNPDRLLVATENAGLARSGDGGVNWQHLDNTCTGRPEQRLPANSTVLSLLAWGPAVYAGTDDGLYASEDGGNCWTQQGSSEGRQYSYDTLVGVPGRPDQLLALTYDATIARGDNHFLWLVERGQGRVGTPLWSLQRTTRALYVDPGSSPTWYVASDMGDVARGALDAAGRWEKLPGITRCLAVLPTGCLAAMAPDATGGPPLLLARDRIYRLAQGLWLHRYWP